MALKAQALALAFDPHTDDLNFPARMLALLDRYHGLPTGMFTGDECLSGRNPVQGTELCAVVETLYSLEHLLALTGDAAYGDRLERIAFNALPATFAPDMWSHQYDQQVNQVQCTINPDHMWSTNGPESNIFGLEPNYGCCTANMHQGWPKFAAHLWMRTPDHGLAAVAYAPSEVQFNSQGVPVRVRLDTDYPFRDTLELTVTVDRPVRFPLLLRIPAWTREPRISVADRHEYRTQTRFVPPHRTGMERSANHQTPLAHAARDHAALPPVRLPRTRSPALFPQIEGNLEPRECGQAAP